MLLLYLICVKCIINSEIDDCENIYQKFWKRKGIILSDDSENFISVMININRMKQTFSTYLAHCDESTVNGCLAGSMIKSGLNNS